MSDLVPPLYLIVPLACCCIFDAVLAPDVVAATAADVRGVRQMDGHAAAADGRTDGRRLKSSS